MSGPRGQGGRPLGVFPRGSPVQPPCSPRLPPPGWPGFAGERWVGGQPARAQGLPWGKWCAGEQPSLPRGSRPCLSICPGGRNGGGGGGGGEAQTSRPGSAAAPSGFQRGSALSAPLWAASGQRQLSNLRAGGGDSDQWEYQRCEAGMTSPRVCLLSEPRQATLPARSQAPAGRLRQQASAGHSRGVPTRRAGSQPGLRPGTSLGASSRLSGCQRWGL